MPSLSPEINNKITNLLKTGGKITEAQFLMLKQNMKVMVKFFRNFRISNK